ncbi:AtzH-like domain-containing protein [Herbiconiux ginsengi]|uniref:AtzH-like domain-containing protein n=1 Tax=Herbiconiux ginsengi TaxID=381665 RepID=UPI001FE12962|nr:AtzH-like domain-containing protein [Herbiconiux ginsengi]
MAERGLPAEAGAGAPVEALPAGVTSLDGAGILSSVALDEVLAAFRGYEAALMANDLDALDRWFAPGPATLRGDASGLLVGHDRISAFRSLRGGVPPRTIVELHLRVLDPASVLVVSVSAFAKGGTGLQTQLWRRSPDAAGWTIAAAHVTGAAPAVNGAVWRVVGAPLLPPHPMGTNDATSAHERPFVSARSSEGVLAGLSVAVKDLYEVAGFAVGAGVPAFLAEATLAAADADAVAALRAAGASVQGIAQTDEFAYSIAGRNVHYGTPPNPAVPGAIPGGSSSGPAAAVALGQAAIGLSTDTGGSIRVPASYQGLWGLRTTHGSVSARGLLPLAPSFDTIGWITRSPQTLRAASAATFAGAPGPTPVGGGGPGDGVAADVVGGGAQGSTADGGQPGAGAPSALEPRYVVSADLVSSCDDDVQAAFGALVAHPVFGQVESVDLGDLDDVFAGFRTVQGAEAWRSHGEWVAAHPGVLGADIAERFDIASRITAAEETDARARLAEARARFDAVLAGRILLLPSASSPAPALDAPPEVIGAARAATLRMTAVAGTGGYPAVSAPLMRVPAPGGSAPVGLCFVGARGADLALLDLAAGVAEVLAGE